MSTFIFAVNAVLPIIILLAFGYFLKHVKFLTKDFLEVGNKYIFRIALPVLLFYNIYKIDSFADIQWNHVLFASASIIALFIIGMLVVLFFTPKENQKGVIVQTIFRANFAIIGVPLAEAIGGDAAVVSLSMISAIVIPLMNVLSVISLTMYMDDPDQSKHIKHTSLKIIKNPLIIAIAIGLVAIGIRSLIPVDTNGDLVFSIKENLRFIYLPIEWLSQTTSPIALIVLGGGFQFDVIKHLSKQIFIGTFFRVLISPLLVLGAAVILDNHLEYFNFDFLVYPAFIALFASPTAISGAVMAKEMGNDYDLANQTVVWTTLFSILSIFLSVLVLRFIQVI